MILEEVVLLRLTDAKAENVESAGGDSLLLATYTQRCATGVKSRHDTPWRNARGEPITKAPYLVIQFQCSQQRYIMWHFRLTQKK
jgi:hypothetical protein